MTSLRPLAEEKHIELIVKPIDPDLVISSDKRKLSQIAINLIGNAIKFGSALGMPPKRVPIV